jgi:hypothetical protein
MHPPYDAPLPVRVRVELVEADVEIVFNLLDMAEAAIGLGDIGTARDVLKEAERVFSDIGLRLKQLGALETLPFLPLVEELRRALDKAESRTR